MKIQSNNFLEKLSKTEVGNLTITVRETLALNFKKNSDKIFSAAELWNIQRNRKGFNRRRFSF